MTEQVLEKDKELLEAMQKLMMLKLWREKA